MGIKKNPAILLNAGAGDQSIFWSDTFCRKLSEKGYFVIRYDYRDAGLSSQIDYEKNPYTILDLVKDALSVLRKYKVNKAYFMGFSMGGQVAQFAGAYYPEYVQGLILLGTSTNFKPGFDAFEGKITSEGLSQPDSAYIKWATRKVDFESQSLEERVKDYIEKWRRLNGFPQDFKEDYYRQEGIKNYTRTSLYSSYLNHAKAMKESFEEHAKAPSLIKAQTLIIQGKEDPVFGIDHGEALKAQIKNSELVIWEDFGHALCPQNFDRIIHKIDEFIKGSLLSSDIEENLHL